MKFLRNLLDDLWEKRLWPIPLALVAALVAVPLLLANSGGADTTGAGTPATPKIGPLASSQPAIDIAQPDSAGRLVHLDKHNPFIQQHLPKAAPTKAAAKSASSAGNASGGAAGGGGGATSPAGGTGGTGGAGPGTTPKTFDVATLDIRFGRADSRQERRNLARLAPLPSPGNAVLIYLGLLSDARTAVFLISSDAHAEGDGSCHPKASNCQTVHMRAGDTEFFDVTTRGGAIEQYELDLLHVRVTRTTDAKVAAAAYVRSSKSGKSLLRSFLRTSGSKSIGNLRYDARRGRLVTVSSPASAWGKIGLRGDFASSPGSDSTTSPR